MILRPYIYAVMPGLRFSGAESDTEASPHAYETQLQTYNTCSKSLLNDSNALEYIWGTTTLTYNIC